MGITEEILSHLRMDLRMTKQMKEVRLVALSKLFIILLTLLAII